jgi:TonB-linked SusC/RagA family outer membrane protein
MLNFKALQKPLMLLALLCLLPLGALAQSAVRGTVLDAAGEPIIGASVKVIGTNSGTVTDINGSFNVQAARDAQLEISYVGYVTQRIAVGGRQSISVTLEEDSQTLSDVVVIGYGTARRSDISGSVASVNTEQMMRRLPTNIAEGLQGAAPGVMVTMQDGAPDANAAVRIRGVATINGNAAPLYVVDGIQVGTNANFLNPSDIESIEILKDASATAIYGSAGANGVIMITTKHGTRGKTNFNITANFGIQTAPSNLDVCSLDQYAQNIRQARYNDNGSYTTWNPIWGEEYDGKRQYIDWLDVMTRTSIKQDYNLSASGGNEKTQYNASVGFLRNDGLVVNTQFQRLTARANLKSQINDFIEFGADVTFVHTDSHGSNNSVGNFGNLSSYRDYAFACPTMDFVTLATCTYDLDGVPAGTHVSPNVINPDGTYGEVLNGKDTNDGMWGTTLGNMYAKQMEKQGRNRNNRAMASAYLSVTPIKGLTWKTLVSYDYSGGSSNDFSGGISRYNIVDGRYINVTKGTDAYVNPGNDNDYSFSLSNNDSQTLDIQNTLTFNWSNDIHSVTAMLGNEVSRWYGQWASAGARGFMSQDIRSISLNTKPETVSANGALNLESRGISYFGRVAYSLMDRYNLTATIRRDGSSNFGEGNRWGTFPSAAASWRISEEPFMKDVDWIQNLKLRIGWGQTGNAGNMGGRAVAGLSTENVKYSFYTAGQGMGFWNGMSYDTGYYAGLVDTNLKWETNEQTNIGLDFGLLGGDLNVTLDYFVRTSKDLLLYRQTRPSTGFSSVYTNYGEIQNKGFEFSLNYNKRLNQDWAINVALTGSTLKNKVVKMGEPVYYTNSDSSGQGTGDGSNTGAVGAAAGYYWGNHSITKEGEAVGSFYGYRVVGIYTDESQFTETHDVFVYDDDGNQKFNDDGTPVTTTGLLHPRDTDSEGQRMAKLGDYIFEDVNNDGVLDEKDMVVLGNGFPKLNYGLTLGATYKNFDFSIYMYGVLGQKIFSYSAMRLSNMFASDDGTCPNILTEVAQNAWTPENPNAEYSRLSIKDMNHNMRASDKWVKNGDFLRIANVQVGYTLPRNIARKAYLESARVFLSISNLACISGYNKYGDPEVGQGSVLVTGLDTGRYPMPRTYTLGLNVTF